MCPCLSAALNAADALQLSTGDRNTGDGEAALSFNTTGHDVTASGTWAFQNNITGSFNIAVGCNAGLNLTTLDNNIDIGNQGVAAEANTIRIGGPAVQSATFIAGIHGIAVTGAAVVVSSTGQLGVAPSSERFTDQIKPMNRASEAILTETGDLPL